MSEISMKDKTILRELAKRQLELANSPRNRALEKQWLLHNTFKGTRPMMHVEMGTFWPEAILPLLKCESDTARNIEATLHHQFFNQEVIGDDHPIRDYFPVYWQSWFTLFGHKITTSHAAKPGLGHRFNYVIEDLEDEYDKLGASDFGIDKEGTLKEEAFCNELFGDILPAKRISGSLYAVPTQKIVHLMGMENMMVSILDYPELFLKMMDRMADDYLAYFKLLETEGALCPTVGPEYLSQGSFCFTDELPATAPIKTTDMWGYIDSQESVGMSPDMYKEFLFPCFDKIAKVFGLLSYGCCEPVHTVWENCLSTWSNLRKVSISAWCDEEYMGEQLRGKNIVFFRKPSPNYLGVGSTMDEGGLRAHFEKTLHAARGCTLEFAQRDVYTIGGDIGRVQRYVQIFKETVEKHWQG